MGRNNTPKRNRKEKQRRESRKLAETNIKPKRCRCCYTYDNLTLDHIRPLMVGGSKYPRNLQWLCLDCHKAKNTQVDPKITKYMSKSEIKEINIRFLITHRANIKGIPHNLKVFK